MHAWCFETILITTCYIFGSNEGIICVLCTLKINHKHFVSMEMAPPIVNKAVRGWGGKWEVGRKKEERGRNF